MRLVEERKIFVSDGESLHRPAGLSGHEGDDDARVHPAAQKGSERDIGDEAAPHRGFKQLSESVFASIPWQSL
jgi:hypothetical protein